MKKLFLLFVVSLSVLLFACEDDDNPGSQEEKVSKVFIDEVEIPNIPFTNKDGDDWDLAIETKPDVYFMIASDTMDIPPADSLVWLDKSAANYSNVSQGDLPLSWSLPASYEIEDWNQPFYVLVFDKDQVVDDDFMGFTGPFTVNNFVDNEVESRQKTSGELITKIYFDYEK